MKILVKFTILFWSILVLTGCEPSISGNSCEDVDTSQAGPFDVTAITLQAQYRDGVIVQDLSPGLDVLIGHLELVVTSEVQWLNSRLDMLDYFIPKAHACTLERPYGVSNIVDFRIALIDNLGNETDVTDLLLVVEVRDMRYPVSTPLTLIDFVALQPPVSREYQLGFLADTALSGEYTLKVNMLLSNGRELESSAGPYHIVNG